MKFPFVIRSLAAPSLICLLALSATNCGKSTAAVASGGSAGLAEAGASGEAGTEAQTISVCGKPAAVTCDPLTARPCNIAAGETCDYAFSTGKFICLKAAAFSRAGEACGANAPDCGPSTTCDDPICQHFCCSDSDCEQGSCTPELFQDGEAAVGVCLDEFVDTK